jgi:hypothetical protein
MYNVDKVHFLLDEMVVNGEIQETSKQKLYETLSWVT